MERLKHLLGLQGGSAEIKEKPEQFLHVKCRSCSWCIAVPITFDPKKPLPISDQVKREVSDHLHAYQGNSGGGLFDQNRYFGNADHHTFQLTYAVHSEATGTTRFHHPQALRVTNSGKLQTHDDIMNIT